MYAHELTYVCMYIYIHTYIYTHIGIMQPNSSPVRAPLLHEMRITIILLSKRLQMSSMFPGTHSQPRHIAARFPPPEQCLPAKRIVKWRLAYLSEDGLACTGYSAQTQE